MSDNEEYCLGISSLFKSLGINSNYLMNSNDFLNEINNNNYDLLYVDEVMLEKDDLINSINQKINDKAKLLIGVYSYSDIDNIPKNDNILLCFKPLWRSKLIRLLNEISNNCSIILDNNNDNNVAVFEGKKILLVEDNALNSEIAYDILSSYGINVSLADDGVVAVDIISNSNYGDFDLVLMDIQMPKMDGYEATKRIRALEDEKLNSIPIVAMTANAFDEDRNNALASGMNDFITKPIRIKEIIDILNKYLK